MSNPGDVDLIGALHRAALAYGRHFIDTNKTEEAVRGVLHSHMDAVVARLQQSSNGRLTAGAPSLPPSSAPPRTDSGTTGTRQNVSFDERLDRSRPFLQLIVRAARQDPPLPEFPVCDEATGNFESRDSLTKIYEQACKALGVDTVQGAVEELDKLQKSNQNPRNQLPFLEMCKESDPRGSMIHWKGWLEPPASPEPPPPPCHHPQYGDFDYVAVIDSATGTECDCPKGDGCKFYDKLRYRVGVGTIDCLGGADCKCEADKVMVGVTRWLPHSIMDDRNEVVDPALEAPRELGTGQPVDGQCGMWPMELVRLISQEEYLEKSKAEKRRGRKPKNGKRKNGEGTDGQKDGDGDTDDDDDGQYSTQSEVPDASTSDEEAVSPPQKQQKTRQARWIEQIEQRNVGQRATRSSARAQT